MRSGRRSARDSAADLFVAWFLAAQEQLVFMVCEFEAVKDPR